MTLRASAGINAGDPTRPRLLEVIVEPPPFYADAVCPQTDPDSFYPEKCGSTAAAKAVCRSCDVKAECLEYALANEERFGIWGGLSERERRRLIKERKSA